MERPETRYVSVGNADVAYQVVGDGPIDLLYFNGTGHVDFRWNEPRFSGLVGRLASFSRVILFDRRGMGASEGVPLDAMPTWEEWTEDMRAVLDAARSESTVVFAGLDAGPIAMLFTAMYPKRVRSLILGNTWARAMVADDYPIGASREMLDAMAEFVATQWGTSDFVRTLLPSVAGDEELGREVPMQCSKPRGSPARNQRV